MIDSPLEKQRRQQLPQLPKLLQDLENISVKTNLPPFSSFNTQIRDHFDLHQSPPIVQFMASCQNRAEQKTISRVGVVCSGGQAPGGHNVIAGLFYALQSLCEKSHLIGFLNGPEGIVSDRYRELDKALIDQYLNTGGFDMIGSGRTKIETKEQFDKALTTCQSHNLDGLVIIGGDDSNTNAALLAKHFEENGCLTRVVGVPKTIDGDLKSDLCEISFGHDTACKLYSELIGNIAKDAASAGKYYHFIRLMGRSASHITLECALQTQPTWALIGEEVWAKQLTLAQIVQSLCDLIQSRQSSGKNHGLFLIPEGLIEFIPEFRKLIDELNDVQARSDVPFADVCDHLTPISAALVKALPQSMIEQLYSDRDPHGNVQVSRIETEKLLVDLVAQELKERKYGGRFSAITHFFGYEARAGLPSLFDSDYTYGLGTTAALLIHHHFNGYLAALSQLSLSVEHWQPRGIPLVILMQLEKRRGQLKPVVQKALVDLRGAAFGALERLRSMNIGDDRFICPGPIQYFGPDEICYGRTKTLMLEHLA